MALRLSSSALAGTAAPAPATGKPEIDSLLASARTALAAGDMQTYRQSFDRALAERDAGNRYWGASRLICEGLAVSERCAPRRLPHLFAAVAAGALQVLEAEPREPLLLNWAGVAMYELWALDGAAVLFEAAHRLDPDLQDPASNLRALASRRNQLDGHAAPSLHPQSRALIRHAERVARRAQPAGGLKISLCMIVRDEQEMLPRCLTAAAPAVDEIVIVDTGSHDATIEIARSFGAKVIEREWTGSFAEARNASFEAATGDWLLYLDADEVLLSEDIPLLRTLSGRTWREAFLLREINHTDAQDLDAAVTNDALRIVRNRPEYRFQGRLHEQIAWSLPTHLPERIEGTSVRIEHFGYLAAVRADRGKSQRNSELLDLQAQDTSQTPFLHYNRGSEHLAAGQGQEAIAEFERAWAMLEQDSEAGQHRYIPTLAIRHVVALGEIDRHLDAFELAQRMLARFPDFTDLVFEQARAKAALGEHERAIALCQRCIAMGDAGRPYTATVGCGTHLPRLLIAELLLDASEEAGRMLAKCFPDDQDRAQTLASLLEALLKLHQFKAFERLLPLLEETGLPERERREMLASMYMRQGFLASAAEEWMAVCACAPDARALVGLAQIARQQDMPAQALDFVQAALDCEPDNPEAQRLLQTQS